MNQVKISPFQFFCLVFMFELGSSIVVGLGLQAKQDAWLAILLGMANGIPLYLIYYYLFTQYQYISLTSYIQKILGKFLGIPLSFVYILYFFYIASRVLRDFGELMITSTLNETPLLAVNGFMIVIITYGILCGLEVIGRTGEFVFFIMMVLIFFAIASLFSSGLIKLENLAPFLESGWKPVISTVYKQTYTFPFGEMIVFTMILPYLTKPQSGWKVGIYGIVASGVILSFTIALEIAILGVNGVATSPFPLLETISRVEIGDFIQRLDVIVVATLIFGVFLKIMVFFYSGFAGVTEVLKLTKKKHKVIGTLAVSLLILFYSILMAGSFPEHIEIGLEKVPVYLHLPLQTGIPVLLFIITIIRKGLSNIKVESKEM
ncbi:GerAB/ArcD/ProY family transporter [Neobacillus sp. LXY-4]|uniref:GerAB/ArcD/ProY family transporter n=1 Tax=Neobacillus sp. LXY-4 TaxID=3379826 RepID=UPI003EE0ECBA